MSGMARRLPYFRPKDLAKLGHSANRLRQLVKSGAAIRVGKGVYRWTDAPATAHDSLALVTTVVPKGVICLLSALRFHDLGTQDPAKVWIAIGRGAWKPRAEGLPIRTIRFSPQGLELGVSSHRVDGFALRVTDPARSIVDCFRYRNRIGLDIGLESLRDGLRRKKVTVDALMTMARAFRVEKVMRPYLEMQLASRG